MGLLWQPPEIEVSGGEVDDYLSYVPVRGYVLTVSTCGNCKSRVHSESSFILYNISISSSLCKSRWIIHLVSERQRLVSMMTKTYLTSSKCVWMVGLQTTKLQSSILSRSLPYKCKQTFRAVAEIHVSTKFEENRSEVDQKVRFIQKYRNVWKNPLKTCSRYQDRCALYGPGSGSYHDGHTNM